MKTVKPSSIKFVEITDIFHIGGTSYDIVEKFKKLVLSGSIKTSEIRLITINYNTSSCNVEKGPVRIYCLNGLAIYLNLTAGYGGSGPTDLCRILELCKVDFYKDDILRKQDIVDIKYSVGNTNWQFCMPDNSFVYSF